MADQNSYTLNQIEEWIFQNSEIGKVQESARIITNASGIKERNEGPADAYRHMLVIGELTRRYGPTIGRIMGEAHEVANPGNEAATAMDLHNNAVGVEIGENAETWNDVVRLARTNGRNRRTRQRSVREEQALLDQGRPGRSTGA